MRSQKTSTFQLRFICVRVHNSQRSFLLRKLFYCSDFSSPIDLLLCFAIDFMTYYYMYMESIKYSNTVGVDGVELYFAIMFLGFYCVRSVLYSLMISSLGEEETGRLTSHLVKRSGCGCSSRYRICNLWT